MPDRRSWTSMFETTTTSCASFVMFTLHGPVHDCVPGIPFGLDRTTLDEQRGQFACLG